MTLPETESPPFVSAVPSVAFPMAPFRLSGIKGDEVVAEADGVHATPTLFINGFKVEGAQPFEILKQYIEDALNGNLNTENG